MNLEFDEDEQSVIDAASAAFAGVATIERIRAEGAAPSWADLAVQGWADLGEALVRRELHLGVAVGVAHRGGSRLLGEPLVTSGMLLSALAAGCENDALRSALRRGPVALAGDGRRIELPVDPTDGGLSFGVDGAVAQARLVRRDDGAIGLDLVARPVERVGQPRGGGSTQTAAIASPSGGWTVVPGRWTDASLEQATVIAIITHSAAMVGCAEAMLASTCSHANERIQFGRPIGEFQAVKHLLADSHASLTVAWSAVLCACAMPEPTIDDCLVSRVLTVNAALSTARTCAQVFGGLGYTWECDLHLYLKAVLDGVQRFGSVTDLTARIGRRHLERVC